MPFFPVSFEELIDRFAALPGIGRKSAQRLAFHVLALPEGEAEAFAETILRARRTVHTCPVCQNLTDGELCSVCADGKRDRSVICVVAEARDVASLERSREYNGVYHVLHGGAEGSRPPEPRCLGCGPGGAGGSPAVLQLPPR